MTLSIWLFVLLIGLAVFQIKRLLDENARQRQQITLLTSENQQLDAQGQRVMQSVLDYQQFVKEAAGREHNVRMAVRKTIGNGANPVVLKRLAEWVFDEEATNTPFDWKD